MKKRFFRSRSLKLLGILMLSGFLLNKNSFSEDVEVKLTTADGTTRFAVQDSGAANVATIDSDGNLAVSGKATVTAAFTSLSSATIIGDLRMNDTTMYIRAGSDVNHGIVQVPLPVDGPRIFGWEGVSFRKMNSAANIGHINATGFYPGAQTTRYLSDDGTNLYLAGGPVKTSGNLIVAGKATVTDAFTSLSSGTFTATGDNYSLETSSSIIVNSSVGRLVFTDAAVPRIDFGIGAVQAKWIGLDTNFYQAFTNDNGFNFNISTVKAWGTQALRVNATGLYPGNQTTRYIYDDATNTATRFSGNVQVDGSLSAWFGGVCMFDLWKDDSNKASNWQGSPEEIAFAQMVINGNWFRSGGDIQMKLVTRSYSNVGTNTATVHLYRDSVSGTWITSNATTSTTSTLLESGWNDVTVNALTRFVIGLQVSESSQWCNMSYASVLVRPKVP